jgi:hypothetical protein
MNAETSDSICGDECPLALLGDSQLAEEAREWAFSPPGEHEGFQDPRFPALGMMAMHYGSLCRARTLTGACLKEAPDADAATQTL